MPYIKQERRRALRPTQSFTIQRQEGAETPGELNYLVTMTIKQYLERVVYRRSVAMNNPHEKNVYTDYNDVIGVLECAKLEMYRRLAVPYEDLAIKSNGDVF